MKCLLRGHKCHILSSYCPVLLALVGKLHYIKEDKSKKELADFIVCFGLHLPDVREIK